MTRAFATATLMLSTLGLQDAPVLAQGNDGSLEDELRALVQATTRLVERLERQERELEADRNLRRVAVAVQVLDIRARQQEGLRRELQELDDRELQFQGFIAANATRMENLERQIAESVDAAKILELEAKHAEIAVHSKNHKQQLEHVVQRRAEIDGLLVEERRLVRDVEGIVEGWLSDLQQPSLKQPQGVSVALRADCRGSERAPTLGSWPRRSCSAARAAAWGTSPSARRPQALVGRFTNPVGLRLHGPGPRSTRGCAAKHALDAEVLIDIRPVHSLTGSNEAEIRPLPWRGLGQSPRPGKWHADHPTVGKVRDDLVLRDTHFLDDRIPASHSAHTMPPELQRGES